MRVFWSITGKIYSKLVAKTIALKLAFMIPVEMIHMKKFLEKFI